MPKLLIDNGRVTCPRRGDIDIEVCVACPDLREVRGDVLVCRIGAMDVLKERFLWPGI